MTPAERLRAAATLLRERAAAATPGPWEAVPGDPGDWPIEADGDYLCVSPDDGVRGGHEEADATYIAMMHPPVALALAKVLDQEARAIEWDLAAFGDARIHIHTLAVADAVLGGEQR